MLFRSQFNQGPLKQMLRDAGIAYVFLGRELGARPRDPSCYQGGRVQYARLAQTQLFREGLRRVMDGAQKYRLALLCAEKEPLACHRALLVARELEACGVDVIHIHGDGTLEPHRQSMVRLLRLLGLADQENFFKDQEQLILDACAMQEEKIAYVDESAEGPVTL